MILQDAYWLAQKMEQNKTLEKIKDKYGIKFNYEINNEINGLKLIITLAKRLR